MKFQLLELNLPFPDKIAKSLAETLRISRNRPLKWVDRLISTGQKPEIWRPLKEVKFPGSLSDTKKNLRERSRSASEGPGNVHQKLTLFWGLARMGPVYTGSGGSDCKVPLQSGRLSSIPASGRSPGEENGNPLQNSCPENSMDRGAWRAAVHGSQRVGHGWASNTSLWPCRLEKRGRVGTPKMKPSWPSP